MNVAPPETELQQVQTPEDFENEKPVSLNQIHLQVNNMEEIGVSGSASSLGGNTSNSDPQLFSQAELGSMQTNG